MICPKCGIRQNDAPKCYKCGFDMITYLRSLKPRKAAEDQSTAPTVKENSPPPVPNTQTQTPADQTPQTKKAATRRSRRTKAQTKNPKPPAATTNQKSTPDKNNKKKTTAKKGTEQPKRVRRKRKKKKSYQDVKIFKLVAIVYIVLAIFNIFDLAIFGNIPAYAAILIAGASIIIAVGLLKHQVIMVTASMFLTVGTLISAIGIVFYFNTFTLPVLLLMTFVPLTVVLFRQDNQQIVYACLALSVIGGLITLGNQPYYETWLNYVKQNTLDANTFASAKYGYAIRKPSEEWYIMKPGTKVIEPPPSMEVVLFNPSENIVFCGGGQEVRSEVPLKQIADARMNLIKNKMKNFEIIDERETTFKKLKAHEVTYAGDFWFQKGKAQYVCWFIRRGTALNIFMAGTESLAFLDHVEEFNQISEHVEFESLKKDQSVLF